MCFAQETSTREPAAVVVELEPVSRPSSSSSSAGYNVLGINCNERYLLVGDYPKKTAANTVNAS